MKKVAFGLTFGSIGVFLLLVAGFLYALQRQFLAKARLATGIVSGIGKMSDDDGAEMYAPIVDFRTELGLQTTYKSNVYSRPSKYKVGDQVEVLYDPDKPTSAQIRNRAMNNMPLIIVGGLGLVFTVLGVLIAVTMNGA